jgi:hypothetical protein
MEESQMAEPAKIVTGIGKAELHRILVRGYDLNKELVGKITFTDMTPLILRGRRNRVSYGHGKRCADIRSLVAGPFSLICTVPAFLL